MAFVVHNLNHDAIVFRGTVDLLIKVWQVVEKAIEEEPWAQVILMKEKKRLQASLYSYCRIRRCGNAGSKNCNGCYASQSVQNECLDKIKDSFRVLCIV